MKKRGLDTMSIFDDPIYDNNGKVIANGKWYSMDCAPKNGIVVMAKLVYETDKEYAGIHSIKWSDRVGGWMPSLVAVPLKSPTNKAISVIPVAWQRLRNGNEDDIYRKGVQNET